MCHKNVELLSLLYQWDSSCLSVTDSFGVTPLQEVERLEDPSLLAWVQTTLGEDSIAPPSSVRKTFSQFLEASASGNADGIRVLLEAPENREALHLCDLGEWDFSSSSLTVHGVGLGMS